VTIFYCLRFIPLSSPPTFVGLRWRCSTPPPHGKQIILKWTVLYNHLSRTEKKNTDTKSTPIIVCFRYSIIACMFISVGTHLPSRCLVMNYFGFGLHITISSSRTITYRLVLASFFKLWLPIFITFVSSYAFCRHVESTWFHILKMCPMWVLVSYFQDFLVPFVLHPSVFRL
jgi:hypothetical protein